MISNDFKTATGTLKKYEGKKGLVLARRFEEASAGPHLLSTSIVFAISFFFHLLFLAISCVVNG
jgi:hypothetical protein